MSAQTAHGVTGGLAVLGGLLVALCIRGAVLAGWGIGMLVETYTLSNLLIGAALLTAGTVLGWHRPDVLIGWLFQVAGLCSLASSAGVPIAIALGHSAAVPVIGALVYGAWPIAIGVLMPLALIAFPSGKLQGRTVRIVAALVVVVGGVFWLSQALYPGDELPNAIGLPRAVYGPLRPLFVQAGHAGSLVWLISIGALIVRFVRGDEETKRRILWIVLGAFVAIAVSVLFTVFGVGDVVILVVFVVVPASMLVAVLRYRVFDIRFVVARSAAWLLLAACAVAIDLALVTALTPLLPRSGPLPVAVAALAVALAFEPGRRLLQRGIDRLMFGRRGTKELLRVLRENLPGGSDATGLVERLRRALGVPGMRLEVEGLGVVAEAGELRDEPATIPLEVQGTATGSLFVGVRRGEATLRRADRELLAIIEPALGMLGQSMRLAAALADSRRRIVESAELERVRLRRDLHDGVASGLTGVRFKIEAARTAELPPAASAALLDSSDDLRASLEALRHVIDDLRPPELDRLGLGPALRTHWSRPVGRSGTPLMVEVRSSPEEPDLPPATEVTAYRIAVEAVTNAMRHSDARTISVELRATADSLHVVVEDDGGATDAWTEGTGLRSMRDRAELLGGVCSAGPSDRGGRVEVFLPIIVRAVDHD